MARGSRAQLSRACVVALCADLVTPQEMLGAQSTVHTPAAGQRSVSTFGTHESHARRADSTAGKRGGDRAKLKAPEGAPPAEEHELQQEVNKAYWVVAKTRMDLTKQIERKEELKSAFDKICDETGVNDSLSPREVRRMLGLFRALGHSRFLTLFRRGDVPLTTSASDRRVRILCTPWCRCCSNPKKRISKFFTPSTS